MPNHSPKRPGPTLVLILLLLAPLTLFQSATRVSEAVGHDFYQFWGVPVALRLTGHTLGSPYRNGERYSAALKMYAEQVNQPKLTAVSRFWRGADFAGSPLLYTVFALVSNDYAFSLRAFQTLQIVSFLGAFLLLGYLYRPDPFALLCLMLLCFLLFQPLLSDLRVANLGGVQLAYCAVLLLLAHALPRVSSFPQRAGLGGLFLAALAGLTLCKPNVAMVTALLAVHLGVRHGRRLFVAAALPASVVAVVLLVLPSLYFGSWTVWGEWYDSVYGSNPYMLVRRVADGNYSTVVLLSSWLGPNVYGIALVLLVLLGASLVVATGWGRGSGRAALSALARLCADPHLAVAIGILLTTAISPLYWFHYHVLSLIPSLWLLRGRAPSTLPAALAATAVMMSSGMFGLLFWWLRSPVILPATIALSWLPLWCALLISIRFPAADAPRAPERARDTEPAAGRVVGTPASRRRKR